VAGGDAPLGQQPLEQHGERGQAPLRAQPRQRGVGTDQPGHRAREALAAGRVQREDNGVEPGEAADELRVRALAGRAQGHGRRGDQAFEGHAERAIELRVLDAQPVARGRGLRGCCAAQPEDRGRDQMLQTDEHRQKPPGAAPAVHGTMRVEERRSLASVWRHRASRHGRAHVFSPGRDRNSRVAT
jgi:hypothetical protein